ncbi:MAG: 3-deoxy-8-phosphooctulonate synthase [Burkholderia sp.]|nr:3-deoxy-8-phosphooctulonate synthase [Burkholderia sp.]
MKLAGIDVGLAKPFFLIAGTCFIESEQMIIDSAGYLKEICEKLDVPFIYKSSYVKTNHSSEMSFRGFGIHERLRIISKVKDQIGIPVLSDVYTIEEVDEISSVADILQTPDFLCLHADLISACARSGKPVSIKKGHFLSPDDMKNVIDKARSDAKDVGLSEDRFLVCECGTSFGYNNIVSDIRSLSIMRNTGAPIVFDTTHSVQSPNSQNIISGSHHEFIPVLARAAIATGISGLLINTQQQDTYELKSDGQNTVPLHKMAFLLEILVSLDRVVKSSPFLENNFI